MQIIIIKTDPATVDMKIMERVLTGIINAKNGQIIIAHKDMTFETLEIEGDGQDLVAVTKDGRTIKIIHDPREDQLPEKPDYPH